jgi:hypothetical protein
VTDLHIEDFYRDVALALNRLFAAFPVPVTLYVEDIAGPDHTDEFGLPSARSTACFSALLWLAKHDYLFFEATIRQEALDGAVLTQRSFVLLSELETDEDGNATRAIDRLRSALRSAYGERISRSVHSLIERAQNDNRR